MKTLLPSKFFSDEALPRRPENGDSGGKFAAECFYSTQIIKNAGSGTAPRSKRERRRLRLFPEAVMARAFWESLPPSARDGGALWPETPARRWKLWKLALAGEAALHSRAARRGLRPARGPLVDNHGRGEQRRLALAESSGFQRAPAARQTRGIRRGALPARRLYAVVENFPGNEASVRRARQRRPPRLRGREGGAGRRSSPCPQRQARRSASRCCARPRQARARGGWAMWLLDRKGYAGELCCEECGWAARCSALRLRDALGGAARAAALRLVRRARAAAGALPELRRPADARLAPRARGALRARGGRAARQLRQRPALPERRRKNPRRRRTRKTIPARRAAHRHAQTALALRRPRAVGNRLDRRRTRRRAPRATTRARAPTRCCGSRCGAAAASGAPSCRAAAPARAGRRGCAGAGAASGGASCANGASSSCRPSSR